MEKEYCFVAIAGALLGTLVFGGQVLVNLGLSLYEISMFTLIFGFLLLPLILFKKEWKFERSMVGFFLVFGFFGAITRLAQFGAVVLGVPVAIVVLLLYTQPLWTVIFSKLFLQESVTRHKIFAIVLVLAGVVSLLNPFSITKVGSFFGIIVALIGGLSLSGYVIYSRKSGIKKYHFITTTFGYTVFTLLFLIVSYPIMFLFTKDLSIVRVSSTLPIAIWLFLFVFSLASNLIPFSLIFRGAQKVPASSLGIILLLEPVSASILATVFLKQPFAFNTLFGGALILISNYLVIHKK
ncbi:MAG: DMT family transporter [Candidatus Bathyarchaeia archaeon]